MTGSVPEWLQTIVGRRPEFRWSYSPEAPLVDFALARETGDVLIADQAGGLTRLDRQGRLAAIIRTNRDFQAIAFSDTGEDGVALFAEDQIGWFDRQLQFRWTKSLADEPMALAITPYGQHAAVALASGETQIFAADQKRVSRFVARRPIKHLRFLDDAPELLVAAEYGLLAKYGFDGNPAWMETLWSTVGGMAVTGDGKSIFLAGFNLGLQVFDGEGQSRGVFAMEGTNGQVSCSVEPHSVLATTLEGGLICLAANGNVRWSATISEPIQRAVVSPLGDYVLVGLASGQIVRLDQ